MFYVRARVMRARKRGQRYSKNSKFQRFTHLFFSKTKKNLVSLFCLPHTCGMRRTLIEKLAKNNTMKKNLIFMATMALVLGSCGTNTPAGEGFNGTPGEVKLLTLDPGHFHAALV